MVHDSMHLKRMFLYVDKARKVADTYVRTVGEEVESEKSEPGAKRGW